MNHIKALQEKKAGAKTLADVFDFLKELQAVDFVWERVQDSLQEEIAGAVFPHPDIGVAILDDIKGIRASLSEMEKEVNEWQLAGPNQRKPEKPEKSKVPMPRG